MAARRCLIRSEGLNKSFTNRVREGDRERGREGEKERANERKREREREREVKFIRNDTSCTR